MPRKYGQRYEKSFFHSGLAIIRSRYLDVFHRHAKKAVPLQALSDTVRAAPRFGQLPYEQLAPGQVVHGLFNTRICERVTAESLGRRMGIAEKLSPLCTPPKQQISFWKTMRAKRLASLYEPIISEPNGPFYDLTGTP